MLGNKNQPYMFVSSFTEEHRPLRHDLYEIGQALGRYVWVCEHPDCRPDLYGRAPLEICDELIAHVREAEIYVAILGGVRRGAHEHGTLINVGDSPSAVSHFEIELFQAALLGKQVELFIAEGFSPGPRLLALLEIVEFALPENAWRAPMSDSDIAREVKRLLCAPKKSNWWLGSRRHELRQRLVTRFYHKRGRAGHARLLFLGGEYERNGPTDESLVRKLLAQVESTKDQEHRLARLWLVVRELMAAPPDDDKFAEFRPLWNHLWVYGVVRLHGMACTPISTSAASLRCKAWLAFVPFCERTAPRIRRRLKSLTPRFPSQALCIPSPSLRRTEGTAAHCSMKRWKISTKRQATHLVQSPIFSPCEVAFCCGDITSRKLSLPTKKPCAFATRPEKPMAELVSRCPNWASPTCGKGAFGRGAT